MKKIISLLMSSLIAVSLFLSLSGCGSENVPTKTEPDSTEDTPTSEQSDTDPTEKQITAPTDEESERINGEIMNFSVEMLKRTFGTDENTLVSPLSAYTILSLLENGADNNTKTQINDVLSGYYNYSYGVVCYADYDPIPVEDMNRYFEYYINDLDGTVKISGDTPPLKLANSIWLRDDDRVSFEQTFTDIGESFYNAGLFIEPFDNSTSDKINSWVDENTDGMIKEIVDNIPASAVTYLINALAFNGKWENEYTADDIYEGDFNNIDDTISSVDFMSSEEDFYISNEYATGFIKNYMGEGYMEYKDPFVDGSSVDYAESRYSFVALLPNEDISIDEYIENYLTAENLTDCIENAEYSTVYAKLPKFEYDNSILLNEVLESFGMTDMFNSEEADFSKLGTSDAGNIYVSRVLQKTYISVDESGTAAAAATAVEMVDNAAAIMESPTYTVTLDRPFVYVIYDKQEKIPVFIGTVVDL